MRDPVAWGGAGELLSFIRDFWVGFAIPSAGALMAFWWKLTERKDRRQREDQEREDKRAERDRTDKDLWIATLVRERDKANADAELAEKRARDADDARHQAVLALHSCRAEFRSMAIHLRWHVNELERRHGQEITKWDPISPP